jgi:hypothetical protein
MHYQLLLKEEQTEVLFLLLERHTPTVFKHEGE